MLNNRDAIIRMQLNGVQNKTIQETVWRLKQENNKSLKGSISITKQNENTLAQSQLYKANYFYLMVWKHFCF